MGNQMPPELVIERGQAAIGGRGKAIDGTVLRAQLSPQLLGGCQVWLRLQAKIGADRNQRPASCRAGVTATKKPPLGERRLLARTDRPAQLSLSLFGTMIGWLDLPSSDASVCLVLPTCSPPQLANAVPLPTAKASKAARARTLRIMASLPAWRKAV
jgi:hypothetical protein